MANAVYRIVCLACGFDELCYEGKKKKTMLKAIRISNNDGTNTLVCPICKSKYIEVCLVDLHD